MNTVLAILLSQFCHRTLWLRLLLWWWRVGRRWQRGLRARYSNISWAGRELESPRPNRLEWNCHRVDINLGREGCTAGCSDRICHYWHHKLRRILWHRMPGLHAHTSKPCPNRVVFYSAISQPCHQVNRIHHHPRFTIHSNWPNHSNHSFSFHHLHRWWASVDCCPREPYQSIELRLCHSLQTQQLDIISA